MELSPTPHDRRARRARRRLATGLGVALLVLVLVWLVPVALGMGHTVVRDSAMGPAVGSGWWRGSLVVDDAVNGDAVTEGDVVVFTPPGRGSAGGPVTRRVVAVADGIALTRGDDRDRVDPWRLDLERGAISRSVVRIPLAGAVVEGQRAWWAGGLGAALLTLAALGVRAPERVDSAVA